MTLTFIGAYSFLNWLVIIKLDLFSVKDYIVDFLLPSILPWILVLTWFRTKLKILKGYDELKNPIRLLLAFAGLTMIFTTCFFQNYIEKATGIMTNLNNIEQLYYKKATKFYTLGTYYFDKKNYGVYYSTEVKGKYGEDLVMRIFFSIPIFKKDEDTLKNACSTWLGIKYSRTINNRQSEEFKDKEFQLFIREKSNEFHYRDVNIFQYLERVGNTSDHDEFILSVENNQKYRFNNQSIIFIPFNEQYSNRNDSNLVIIIIVFVLGCLIWLITLTKVEINEKKHYLYEKWKKKAKTHNEIEH